jgi:protein gp37
MWKVLNITKARPQHTFMFLTKNGKVYKDYDFPINCWLGITTTDGNYTFEVKGLNLVYISYEPLLKEPSGLWLSKNVDWLIVGGLTPKPVHKKEWIDKILITARKHKIPVFIKNNANYPRIIQDFPDKWERK